ncbi:MAG TPA: DUF2587 domain-containing protein [Acidimicrobiaceae bacterium]|mgnify:CR=1 FL=1|jgi:hypothetical protein|nr:DUF2587 domain-containing protein [Acidimicrobiaceae bacterium]
MTEDHTKTEPERVAPDSIASEEPSAEPDTAEAETIESPAKIIRIGEMVKILLEELRNTTLDEAARDHLRDLFESSVTELKSALPSELREELSRLTRDFDDDTVPSESQLRVAHGQLVGWLQGLFHGIQATLMAQQVQARQQLDGLRGQLPESHASGGPGGPGQGVPGGPGYI